MTAINFPLVAPRADRPRVIPGEGGVWVFIFGDLLAFSLYFIAFLHYRGDDLALFQASQATLNQTLGTVNTGLMLLSSWCVATAVSLARNDRHRAAGRCIGAALLCGLGFVVIKGFEYSDKIRAGISLTTNDFYMFYFIFTGIHLLHVLIGMVVLAFMARLCAAGRLGPVKVKHIESGACFWHAVDLLWMVLFALFYLLV